MTIKHLLSRAFVAAAALGIVTAGGAAAAGPPNKSGGGTAPVELTLLNSDDDLSGVPAVARFVDRVAELSAGKLLIEVRPQNDGGSGDELRVVRDVTADKFQFAWVGTRVWDVLGVNTFRALHAPMLVDSYALEGAVLRSDLPAKMLAGLDGRGIVGLALLGDNLRYPAGVNRQLRSPADFKGLRFRTITSATQAAALRALGAHPSTEGHADLGAGLQSGRLGGFETDFNTYESNGYATVAPFVTVNAALWPRTTVLFANAAALSKLSGEQQGWIRQAADDAARYALTTFGEDSRIVPVECRNGMKAVVASPGQLAALRNAFAPVYASLRKDPVTARMIGEITALKRGVKATPLAIPSGCRATTTPEVRSGATPAGTAFPEGVFRGRRTGADVRRVWPNADADALRANAATVTFTFKNGTFGIVLSDGGVPGCRHGEGTYSINGHFLTTRLLDAHGCPGVQVPGPPLTLRWSYEDNKLRFRLVQAALPLIHVIWEAVPVERIS
jgi:TRAP-type transport system periplasmic protein